MEPCANCGTVREGPADKAADPLGSSAAHTRARTATATHPTGAWKQTKKRMRLSLAAAAQSGAGRSGPPRRSSRRNEDPQ
eukprot:scaffold456_cov390-Prasinococcus_capsulatus_cf.AAC.10